MLRIVVIDDWTAPALRKAIVEDVLSGSAPVVIAVGNRHRKAELLLEYPDLLPSMVVVSRRAVYE